MLDPARIRNLLIEKNLSQSELARRIGVTQATIYRVVSGHVQGSKYLHLIARELGSTPAYLTGELDDPTENGEHSQILSKREQRLLEASRKLSDIERNALVRIAEAMARPDTPTVHDVTRPFRHEKASAPRKPTMPR